VLFNPDLKRFDRTCLIRGRGPSFLSATNFDLKVLSFLKVKLNLLCGPDFNPLGLERFLKSLLVGLTFTVDDCEHRGYFSYILMILSFFFIFFIFLQDPCISGDILFYNDYFRLIFMVFVRSILLGAFYPYVQPFCGPS